MACDKQEMQNSIFKKVLWGLAFRGGTSGKERACQGRRHRRHELDPWVRKLPWRRARLPMPVFLLGNPMDRGAWQATVHKGHRVAHDWSNLAHIYAHTHCQALGWKETLQKIGKEMDKFSWGTWLLWTHVFSCFLFFFFFWCRVYTDSCKMSVSNTGKSFILSFNRGAIFKEGCWLFFLKIFSPKLSF